MSNELRTINNPPPATPRQLAEAERLRAAARRSRGEREESFRRCDTDGFLSQWASGITASRDERLAEVLEHGGCGLFTVLMEGHRVVNARQIKTRYGWCWMLHPVEEQRFGRKFIPLGESMESRSRVQDDLGLSEAKAWLKAVTAIEGEGRGLSGCASAFVATKPSYDALRILHEQMDNPGATLAEIESWLQAADDADRADRMRGDENHFPPASSGRPMAAR